MRKLTQIAVPPMDIETTEEQHIVLRKGDQVRLVGTPLDGVWTITHTGRAVRRTIRRTKEPTDA